MNNRILGILSMLVVGLFMVAPVSAANVDVSIITPPVLSISTSANSVLFEISQLNVLTSPSNPLYVINTGTVGASIQARVMTTMPNGYEMTVLNKVMDTSNKNLDTVIAVGAQKDLNMKVSASVFPTVGTPVTNTLMITTIA